MQDKLEVCIKDWAELADEYKELELRHKEYREVSQEYLDIFFDLLCADLGQVLGPAEEMCVRGDSSEVQTGGYQEADQGC
jgi:hypothetical protein